MIEELQSNLQLLYEIETKHRVSNFITSNARLKAALLASDGASKETVFIREEGGCLDIAVFIDEEVLRQLSRSLSAENLLTKNIANYCYALEGVSHFLYLVYNVGYDRSVNLLEMELQAEVDKYIMLQTMIDREGNGRYKLDAHSMVFEDTRLRSGLSSEETTRYKDANFFAGKFCQSLLRNYIGNRNPAEMNRQLRRFYRLPLQEKIRLINHLH
jgi:hypothetical protein